jgi:hypothetical protein
VIDLSVACRGLRLDSDFFLVPCPFYSYPLYGILISVFYFPI